MSKLLYWDGSKGCSKDKGKHKLQWVALTDRPKPSGAVFEPPLVWKYGLPATTKGRVIALGRHNAAARAREASTSATTATTTSAAPEAGACAPTAVKGKGKRRAAEEKPAASGALASAGFDMSVPVGELPLATKRTTYLLGVFVVASDQSRSYFIPPSPYGIWARCRMSARCNRRFRKEKRRLLYAY